MNSLHCDTHDEMIAVGTCEVCGKPVCGDCAITIDGRIFCEDRLHPVLYNDMQELVSTATIFEMELIAENLRANGVDVHWFDVGQYGTLDGAKLFVKKEAAVSAITILNTLDLIDFTVVHTYGK
ncbi:MAG: hypothetical protein WCT99_01820 [Bacteroidota bacterium]|jgi:hypothetical protein